MARYCVQCGSELEPDYVRCATCGYPVSPPEFVDKDPRTRLPVDPLSPRLPLSSVERKLVGAAVALAAACVGRSAFSLVSRYVAIRGPLALFGEADALAGTLAYAFEAVVFLGFAIGMGAAAWSVLSAKTTDVRTGVLTQWEIRGRARLLQCFLCAVALSVLCVALMVSASLFEPPLSASEELSGVGYLVFGALAATAGEGVVLALAAALICGLVRFDVLVRLGVAERRRRWPSPEPLEPWLWE